MEDLKVSFETFLSRDLELTKIEMIRVGSLFFLANFTENASKDINIF